MENENQKQSQAEQLKAEILLFEGWQAQTARERRDAARVLRWAEDLGR